MVGPGTTNRALAAHLTRLSAALAAGRKPTPLQLEALDEAIERAREAKDED